MKTCWLFGSVFSYVNLVYRDFIMYNITYPKKYTVASWYCIYSLPEQKVTWFDCSLTIGQAL